MTAQAASHAKPEGFDPFRSHVMSWLETAVQLGFMDYLSPEDGFRTCTKTARKWANSAQPGIYFWIAENGEAYVGQSVRPQARLRQHMIAHGDILRAAFLCCEKDELDEVERRLVHTIGDHFPLRNIKHAVSTASDVPLDQLVTRTEQEVFLTGVTLPDMRWRGLDHLNRLQARKFAQFLKHPKADEALGALRTFIRRSVPKPAATEVRFWSATIKPQGCFIRVNAGQQEVFTYEVVEGRGYVRVLTDERIRLLRSERMRYQTPSYVTEVQAPLLDAWLKDKALLSSRRLVIQLMRHTQALNSGSHCPQAVRFAGPE